jgi:hypothetical protein
MINTLKREAVLCASIAAVLFAMATPALSQAPTDAQRSAIRAECRADYQAHCSSVPPGGMASLQCLQQNMSSLSPGCQTAVRAVEAPAPKAEQAPPPAEPAAKPAAQTEPAAKPAAETEPAAPAPAAAPKAAAPKAATASAPSQKPSSSQIAAIRSACRSDYQRNCAGVPTGGAAALQCLEKNKANLSGSCQKAVSAASGGAPAPAASATAPADTGPAGPAGPGAAPAAAASAPALNLRPMRPREILFVLRSACGGDARSLCGDVPPGGGRIVQCLAAQAASLSPACADVLGQFSAQ